MPKQQRLLLLMLAVAACADERSHDPSILDHGNGTYSMTAVAGRDTTTTRREGGLTWTYVGQATHSWNPTPMRELSYVTKAPEPDKGALGMKREDADGSVWKVTAIDDVTIANQVARANASSIEFQRGLHLADPNARGVTAVEPIGVQKTIRAESWRVDSCDNTYYMNDDDRIQVAADNDRRKAVVEIGLYSAGRQCPYDGDYASCLSAGEDWDWCKRNVLNCVETNPSTSGICTGTILRDRWVLTAAHCVYDDFGNSVSNSNLKIRRPDGVQVGWLPVTSKFVDSGYEPNVSLDPTDDWVLLKLTTALTAPYSDMDISGASDTTLSNAAEVVNLAYPAFAPECTPNSANAMWMNNSGELGTIYSNKVNFKIDGGPGHSGSPVFYCPGGDGDDICEGSETGFVIGIVSGWDGAATTRVGPKGPEQRANAISIMDNN